MFNGDLCMRNDLEFINLLDDVNVKSYKRVYKKILKRIKKELSIKEKLGLSVTFCDNAYIHDLNKQYRNKYVPTDVLSFAIEDGESEQFIEELGKLSSVREIGDIIISYEKAQSQAIEYNHSLNRELCFLFTHGVLHLLGYDHMNKSDEEVMFALQNKILDSLKIYR